MPYEMEQLQICRGTGGQMFFRNQKFSVLQVQGREKVADHEIKLGVAECYIPHYNSLIW